MHTNSHIWTMFWRMVVHVIPRHRKKRSGSLLEKQNVLIIDDVTTSGSTLNEVLRTLRILNEDNEITIFSLIGRKDLMADSFWCPHYACVCNWHGFIFGMVFVFFKDARCPHLSCYKIASRQDCRCLRTSKSSWIERNSGSSKTLRRFCAKKLFCRNTLSFQSFFVFLPRLHIWSMQKAEADGWGYIYWKGVCYDALFFDSPNVSQT